VNDSKVHQQTTIIIVKCSN